MDTAIYPTLASGNKLLLMTSIVFEVNSTPAVPPVHNLYLPPINAILPTLSFVHEVSIASSYNTQLLDVH